MAPSFIKIYKSLMRMQIEKFGSLSYQAIETRGLMSALHMKLGNHNDANVLLREVLRWQQRNLDMHHPALKNTHDNIKKLTKAIGSVNEINQLR